MAEYLFHHNPAHGRSYKESKPWLIRTKELDPNNQEVNIHLMDIALAENDIKTMKAIFEETDSSSQYWPSHKSALLSVQDNVTASERLEIINHPQFKNYYLDIFLAAPEDATAKLKYLESYLPQDHSLSTIVKLRSGLYGKEKMAYEASSIFAKSNHPDYENYDRYYYYIPASLMTGNGFAPMSESYEELLLLLKGKMDAWAVFAQAKYAIALGQGNEAAKFKKVLKKQTENQTDSQAAKYFLFSLVVSQGLDEG